jgi:hypothetical protein
MVLSLINKMRIWHEDLIPYLKRQHLLAVWREALGCYKIITENKKGYRNHPAVIEFTNAKSILWERLYIIRQEMLKRGYHPKELPEKPIQSEFERVVEWQSLEQQKQILFQKDSNWYGKYWNENGLS